MKKNYCFLLLAMLLQCCLLTSCHEDESIETTNIAGNWFVSRIESITAKNVDDDTYDITNKRDYDSNYLADGSMLVTIADGSSYNTYFVVLYKYINGSWVKQNQENVALSSKNKFSFNGEECKFNKGNDTRLAIKTRIDGQMVRVTLNKTNLRP